ncbi:MAG TPA: SMP-30/gluconolactonase/LRE family protein [Devosiaceae bacterium]
MPEAVECTLVLNADDIVGESIVWDDRRQVLYWVDIGGKRIHRLDPQSGEHKTWPAPEFPTSIGLREDGGAILGMTRRVALWDFDGDFRTLAIPEPNMPDNRLNEGRVAPDGSFWVGTMSSNLTESGEPKDQGPKSGYYYRVDGTGAVTRLCADAFGITNTMIWAQDGVFITADTTENALYRYRVSPDRLALSDRQAFGQPFERGLPDGSCLDSEGGIWTCRVVGGSCLTRTLMDGTVDRVVELDCSWPTSCTFGGPNLDTLFVTSARFTMTAEHLQANPQEGAVFAVRPGVAGLREPRFRFND